MLSRLVPIAFVLLWSSGFIGAKFGLPFADPFSFLLVRFLLAAPIMAVVAFISRSAWPPLERLPHVVLAGLLVHALYLGGVFFAIGQGLGAAPVALIVGLQPIMTAAVAGPFLGERITLPRLCGLLLGLLGVSLVVGEGAAAAADLPPLGLLGAVLALAGITIGTVVQKRYCGQFDPRPVASIQYAASALPMVAAILIAGESRIEWTGQFAFALGWLTLMLSVGAISLLYWLLRRGEAVGVANLFNLTPPTTAVLAWALFGEPLTWLDGLGFAFAAVGVWVVARNWGQKA